MAQNLQCTRTVWAFVTSNLRHLTLRRWRRRRRPAPFAVVITTAIASSQSPSSRPEGEFRGGNLNSGCSRFYKPTRWRRAAGWSLSIYSTYYSICCTMILHVAPSSTYRGIIVKGWKRWGGWTSSSWNNVRRKDSVDYAGQMVHRQVPLFFRFVRHELLAWTYCFARML